MEPYNLPADDVLKQVKSSLNALFFFAKKKTCTKKEKIAVRIFKTKFK